MKLISLWRWYLNLGMSSSFWLDWECQEVFPLNCPRFSPHCCLSLDNSTGQQSELLKRKWPNLLISFHFIWYKNLNSFPWITILMILFLLILKKSSLMPWAIDPFCSILLLDHVKLLRALGSLGCFSPACHIWSPGSFWRCFFPPFRSQIKIYCLRQDFADYANEI